uniref:RNA polymerase subunit alpha n=1 Tax=Euglena deses TaxID=66845 RepID=UPI0023AA581E|nr:RNA polymerase subunit alpha [Euglena deses]WCH63385.1 RNA polymerase subunit alpha [Euglena deses]
MKLIKVSLVRNKVLNCQTSTLFKIQLFSSSNFNLFANVIRRSLIKNSFFGIKIVDLLFFVSPGWKDSSRFHLVNEFLDLEEVFPSMMEIYNNFNKINFYSCNFIKNDKFLGIIDFCGKGLVKVSDIRLPKFIKVFPPDLNLFSVLSSKLKCKVKIEKQNFNKVIFFEVISDLTKTSLENFFYSLYLLNKDFKNFI